VTPLLSARHFLSFPSPFQSSPFNGGELFDFLSPFSARILPAKSPCCLDQRFFVYSVSAVTSPRFPGFEDRFRFGYPLAAVEASQVVLFPSRRVCAFFGLFVISDHRSSSARECPKPVFINVFFATIESSGVSSFHSSRPCSFLEASLDQEDQGPVSLPFCRLTCLLRNWNFKFRLWTIPCNISFDLYQS